jgi:hypothetical protein
VGFIANEFHVALTGSQSCRPGEQKKERVPKCEPYRQALQLKKTSAAVDSTPFEMVAPHNTL